jgi:hypothetical protein
LAGAHVQKSDVSDISWYIITLFSSYNKGTGVLETMERVKFISACGWADTIFAKPWF